MITNHQNLRTKVDYVSRCHSNQKVWVTCNMIGKGSKIGHHKSTGTERYPKNIQILIKDLCKKLSSKFVEILVSDNDETNSQRLR